MNINKLYMMEKMQNNKKSGPEFFQTIRGREYYEYTLPNLVNALEHLATTLDKKDIVQLDERMKNEFKCNVIEILHASSVHHYFPETVQGNRFYDHVLPKLIKNIDNLTKELEKD